jgi:PAS domain S-box-containing protein
VHYLLGLLWVLLGLGVYLTAARREAALAQDRFHAHVAAEAAALKSELAACTESLFALRALYEASESVTEREFHSFATDLLSRRRTARALAWAPRVTRAQRLAFAQGALLDEEAGWAAREAASRCDPGADEDQDDHYPVRYVESRHDVATLVGLDLGHDPTQRAALERAADGDEPVMAAPLLTLREGEWVRSARVLLAHRADRGGGPLAVPGSPVGVFVLEFLVDDVVTAALLRPDNEAPGHASFVLEDPDAAAASRYLFASEGAAPLDVVATSPQRFDVNVAGRRWRLHALAGAAFTDRHTTGRPLLLGLVVLLLAGSLHGFLTSLARRAARHAERSQERTMTSVLESLDDAAIVADERGRVQFANAAAQAVVGVLPPGTALPSRVPDWGLLQPDGVSPYDEAELPLTRALRGEHVADQLLCIRNRLQPGGRWFRVNAVPLIDEGGGRRGGVIVARDVTRSRVKEAQLQQLHRAVDQTADAVLITDRDGTIEYVNPAFTQVTGFPAETAIGMTPRILKSGVHSAAFYRAIWDRILAGKVYQGTVINRHKDGHIYYAEQTITPMRNEQGEVTNFVASLKDMTDVRRREEQAVELRLAGQVQQRLFPQGPPVVAGLDIAGAVFPAELACGDYFDYLALPSGEWAVAVGDVSGHGMGPALMMAETRAYLRAYLATGAPPASVFSDLNRTLSDDLASGNFVTLMLASFDVHRRQLTWTNAGHTEALVLNRAGRLKVELTSTGPVLGVIRQGHYATAGPLALDVGDVVLLLTDGIIETRNPRGEFFDQDLVLDAIRPHLGATAQAMSDRLFEALRVFAAGRATDDDQTLVVCKVVDRLDNSAKGLAGVGS